MHLLTSLYGSRTGTLYCWLIPDSCAHVMSKVHKLSGILAQDFLTTYTTILDHTAV